MTVAIHAELTTAGDRVVLIAGGLVDDVAYAAKQLQHLTPLIKRSDPPGALVMPLSWAGMVQLAATYGDRLHVGDRLRGWLTEQRATRTFRNVDSELSVPVPDGLTARPYQVDGALLIARTGHALIFDEPRTGKTITTILGLGEWLGTDGHFIDTAKMPWLVVAPASVVDPWVEAFTRWAPYLRTVAWRGSPARRRGLIGTADVYVTSYDTARIDAKDTNPGRSPLIALNPAALVVDECFPAGTPIATPDGPRAIEDLRPGDDVIGIDHETGEAVVTTVHHAASRDYDDDFTDVLNVAMTPGHPVWTTRGYVPAASVRPSDTVCHTAIRSLRGKLHADVRVVRADFYEGRPANQAPPVLQPELLGEVAHVQTGFCGVPRYTEAAGSLVGSHASTARASGRRVEAAPTPARADQSASRPDRPGESSGNTARAGLPDADRRQRPTDGASEAVGGALGLGHRGRDRYRPQIALPEGVQGGRGVAGADDRDRDRRRVAQEPERAGAGPAQGPAADESRLDGAAVHQRAGADGNGRSDGRDHHGRVFNIETGTGNYIAGGLLVHNCHYIKNQQAARTKAVRRLARNVAAFVALSGTPITHHPGDLWPTLDCFDRGAWPARERWVNRYCLSGVADYGENILGLNPGAEPEFRLTLLGQHRRAARADVMSQLPAKVYSLRTVELPAAHRKVYDDFERDMLAELPDGQELSVMDVLSQLTFLSQLASAAADVQITWEQLDDGDEKRHVHIELKNPSWKVDALLEVLAERPGEQTVAFAPSAQLMRLAGQAATAAGYKVGYVIGGQTPAVRTADIAAFQTGELDLICATTSAGGVGITLSAAGTLVFLQRPWSLVQSLQAEDRAEGDLSKKRGTEIIDIVASNTIDTRVRSVLRERAGQLADFVQDPRIVAELLGGATVTRLKRSA